MTLLAGIAATGAFVPRLRLSRATIHAATGWTTAPARAIPAGQRSCCNWDEDSLTLAVEAARIPDADVFRHYPPVSLLLASTTLPFADRSNATVVAEALDLPDTVETMDCTGSLRAGTGALACAARRRDGASLVIASDARRARPGSSEEQSYGAGAAALLVVPTVDTVPDGMLAVILGSGHLSSDFVDHYRMAGEEYDYGLEERWVRDEGYSKLLPRAVAAALQSASVEASAIRHFIFPRSPSAAKRVAVACGLTGAATVDSLSDSVGDTGTAHPFLMLAAVLESAQPGELILMVGFGQGVDALVIRTLPAVSRRQSRPLADALAQGIEEPNYVRYLSHSDAVDVDFGMRAERDNRTAHTVAYRKRRAVTGFVGGRCSACETVQFPRSRVCVNPDCRATDTQADYRLAESTGRVKTFTEDWQAFAPRPPLIYGNVEFAEGGNLLMEMTDAAPGQIAAGARVRFRFRIKDRDRMRGYRRYFWKAAPL